MPSRTSRRPRKPRAPRAKLLELHHATPQQHRDGYSHADPPDPYQPSWVARVSYQCFYRGNGRFVGIVPHGNRLTFGDPVEKTVRHFNFSRKSCERSVRGGCLARPKLVGEVTDASSVLCTSLLLRDGRLGAASAGLQALRQLRVCAVFDRDRNPKDQSKERNSDRPLDRPSQRAQLSLPLTSLRCACAETRARRDRPARSLCAQS